MSGQSIIDGLEEALAYMEDSATKAEYQTHTREIYAAPEHVDVKRIRQQMGMSQPAFAANFGLSLYTLRGWEQGRRKPDPAARAYLTVNGKAPDAVRAAIRYEVCAHLKNDIAHQIG